MRKSAYWLGVLGLALPLALVSPTAQADTSAPSNEVRVAAQAKPSDPADPSPCCSPQIASVKDILLTTIDYGPGMTPEIVVKMNIRYRCWPHAPWPNNDPMVYVGVQQGENTYVGWYDGGGIPSPICDATWRTLPARTVDHGLHPTAGKAHLVVGLTIRYAPDPMTGENYAHGSDRFERNIMLR